MLLDVRIEEPEVVVKSYPEYWEHLSEVITQE
jgi:5-enolpyruvylshikimate-3-phosphate synthase